MQLSGLPRLAGIDRPYATAAGPIQDAWEERRDVVRGRLRTRKKGFPEYWPSWQFSVLVTAGQWLGLRSDLAGDAAGEVDWVPRTRTLDDPAWLPERAYRVRCTSDLPTLEELRLRDTDGRGLYAVDVALEGVAPLAELPDHVDGGYDLLYPVIDVLSGEVEGCAVAPYGRDAQMYESGIVRVTLLGEDFDLTAVTLGGPLCASARAEASVPYDGGTLGLDVALRRPHPTPPPPMLGPVFVHPTNL